MLAIFERYFGLIRTARNDADMLNVLQGTAREFGLRDAFLIEYEKPAVGRNFLLDTNPDRAEWWDSYHHRTVAEMPAELRRQLETEPVVLLGRDRTAMTPPEMRETLERFGFAEVTLIPIRSDGALVGVVGFSGIVPLTPPQSTALQMIGINVFAQMRALRQLSFKATPGTLTKREREVLALSADGLTSQQIALRLGMSARTVNQHVDNVADKLGTRNRAHTVAEVIRHGLLN